jgi:hypothetical protein
MTAEQPLIVEQLKFVYRNFSSQSLVQLPSIYRDDVVFVDPVHRLQGLAALHGYLAGMVNNLAHCEFVYDAQTVAGDSACICWNMHFRHESLRGGAALSLRGISRICFDDRIYYHEDFYDLGAMLYENVPLVGGITRFLKRRLAS